MNILFLLPALLCPILAIVIIVVVVKAIFGRRPGVMVAPAPLDVMAMMGDDGFWLDACPGAPGSMVHFHYWSNGVRYAGQVPWQPGMDGRQFIYTGIRPEQVAVLQIVAASGIYGGGPVIIDVDDSPVISSSIDMPDFGSSPPPSSGGGFPSAY